MRPLLRLSVNWKKILLFAFSSLFAIMILEFGSRLIIANQDLNPAESYFDYYRRMASNTGGSIFMAHPYFGYALRKGNNYGFLEKKDFPYKRRNGEFVVGIFGGSTATWWAQYLNRTHRWIHIRPGKKVVVLNMANFGLHQPQQMIIASRFLDTLDVAVVLDGWNDTIIDLCPQAPGDYPQSYALLFSDSEEKQKTLWIRILAEAYRGLNNWASSSWLGTSNTVYLISRILHSKINNGLAEQSTQIAASIAGQRRYPECDIQRSDRTFDNWVKYTRQMKALANLNNVPLFHFVQPNPYVTGAKPLGPNEAIAVQYNNREFSEDKRRLMQEFLKRYALSHLSHSTDLTFVFRNEKRQVYIDQFTHLNDLGYSIISQAVEAQLRHERIWGDESSHK